MKKIKSLTCLLIATLLGACQRNTSATFSSQTATSSSASPSVETSLPRSDSSSSENISSTSSIISSQTSSNVSTVSSSDTSDISADSSNETSSSNSLISSSNSTSVVSSSETSSSSIISSSESSSSSSSEITSSSSSSSTSQSIPPLETYYAGYYDNLVSWSNGEDLKNQLYEIIRTGYTPLAYTKSNKQNYDTNIHADHCKNDFEYLDVIYSKTDTFKTETNKGWQREHAWCASLMCGSGTSDAVKYKGRATDFHNLFAANASGNQSRGNKNYGYANPLAATYDERNQTNDGEDGYTFDETTFEPGDVDKGRLARAIFYMATMYKNDEYDTSNNINMRGLAIVEEPVSYVAGNNCAFAIGNLTDLLEWNEDYKVDYLEMQHNISVYTDTNNPDGIAQGNRNPFIDYPGLVDYVYGSKKNQPGSLKDVVAAASYLDIEEDTISHYALLQAKREHGYGETLSKDDYEVVAVKKNYSYELVSANIANSLDGHTFTESDGDYIDAMITTPLNTLNYQILLNPMGACSDAIILSSSGISATIHNSEQDVTFGGIPFILRYDTTIADNATFYIRNISTGGVTLGSSNSEMTSFVLKTKNEYTIDKAFIKACASNTSSQFNLTIKVGEAVLLNNMTVLYLKSGFNCYGGALTEPLTGQVSFIFTGSNALKINSIAFNRIIA